MRAKNKKGKFKGGFTLVECVVAMAVLAIMSLLLMMILSVTVNRRNKNMEQERAIDTQVMMLEGGSPIVTDAVGNIVTDSEGNAVVITQETEVEALDPSVVFEQGTWSETMPGNAADGVVANKKTFIGDNAIIGKFEYEFDSSIFEKSSSPGPGPGPGPTPEDPTVGGTHITAGPTTTTSVVGGKKMLTISFTCDNVSDENSYKYTLPAGWHLDKIIYGSSSGADISVISERVIKIKPTAASPEVKLYYTE